MIKKTLFALSLILGMSIFIYQTTPQEKEYTVTMNIQEWNTVVLSINSPDDVTKNQKAAVLTKMVGQINKQLQDTVIKKK